MLTLCLPCKESEKCEFQKYDKKIRDNHRIYSLIIIVIVRILISVKLWTL
jgi:hypothetical protein